MIESPANDASGGRACVWRSSQTKRNHWSSTARIFAPLRSLVNIRWYVKKLESGEYPDAGRDRTASRARKAQLRVQTPTPTDNRSGRPGHDGAYAQADDFQSESRNDSP